MDLGIAGFVAVVTGADSGIGFAVARHLLAEGDAMRRHRAEDVVDAVVIGALPPVLRNAPAQLMQRACEAFGVRNSDAPAAVVLRDYLRAESPRSLQLWRERSQDEPPC